MECGISVSASARGTDDGRYGCRGDLDDVLVLAPDVRLPPNVPILTGLNAFQGPENGEYGVALARVKRMPTSQTLCGARWAPIPGTGSQPHRSQTGGAFFCADPTGRPVDGDGS